MTSLPSADLPALVMDEKTAKFYQYMRGSTLRVDEVPPDGLRFMVPLYKGRKEGDSVRMCTSSGRGEPIYGPSVTLSSTDGPSVFLTVRSITLIGLSLESEELIFHYQVTKPDGRTFLSMGLPVPVANGYPARRLDAPLLLNTVTAEGMLPDTEAKLKLRIERPQEGWDLSLDIYLLGTNSTVPKKSVTTAKWHPTGIFGIWGSLLPAKGIDFTPFEEKTIDVELTGNDGFKVEASKGRVLRVWYTCDVNGTKHVSSVTEVKVEGEASPPSALSIGDDAQMHVEPYCVVVGVPPNDAPPQAVLWRAATGGASPYTYCSSNRYVAAVDANGKVTATGNGRSTITVTDAKGENASFNLTVTGAFVLMCVRNEPFVDSEKEALLQPALTTLHGRQYGGSLVGVMPSVGHLRAIWKQYRDLLPGLARKLQWEQRSDDEAFYWTRDTTRNDSTSGTGAYRVNLNASDEDSLVEIVPYGELAASKSYLAMVEANHWLGFETFEGRYSWYQDGSYARAALPSQPWRAPRADDPHDKDQYGDF